MYSPLFCSLQTWNKAQRWVIQVKLLCMYFNWSSYTPKPTIFSLQKPYVYINDSKLLTWSPFLFSFFHLCFKINMSRSTAMLCLTLVLSLTTTTLAQTAARANTCNALPQ